MKIPQENIALINVIKSNKGEYYDDYLRYDSRERFFWNLSCVRRHSLDWYPFTGDSKVLVVGDNFGAIVGAVCDRANQVDVLVDVEEYAETIKVRYSQRSNLNVYTYGVEDFSQLASQDCAIVYLEDNWDYDWNNSYQVDNLLQIASEHLSDDAKLIVMARGDKAYDLKRILYKKGFVYQNSIDPLGTGYLFIESSRNSFEPQNILPEQIESNRDKLVDSEWVKSNWLPLGGGEVFDQDIALIDNVKKVEIDLLSELLCFCKEHSLRVYPIYGTLLGIMRDGGMIPGDDDVDVAMPREDFDKLVVLRTDFSGDYFLQTPYNDNCFYGGYLKLRNKSTTAINPQNEFVDVCEGIGIDIFPLDNVFANSFKEKCKKRIIRFLQRLLFAKSYGYFRQFRDMPMLKWKAYKYFGKLFDKKKLVDRLYKKMEEGQQESGKYAIYCHYNGRLDIAKYFNKKDFKKTFSLNYEGQLLDVPAGWNNVLISTYGEGYLEKPGFNEWKQRHGFYDVSVPYHVYKKRFGGLKYPSTITEPIVLFGDGSVFKGCLEYYQSRVNITYLVQLPGESKIESVMGMKVYSWDEFEELKVPRESYRAIICSGNSRRAESILKANGFEDYYIFWYNRQWMLYANQSAIWAEIERSK